MLLLATVATGLAFLTIPTSANAILRPRTYAEDLRWIRGAEEPWKPDYGINCRGSFARCTNGANIEKMADMIKDIDPNHHYQDMESIACIAQNTIFKDRSHPKNAVCLFAEGFKYHDGLGEPDLEHMYGPYPKDGIMGVDVPRYLQLLLDHDCHACGIVPLGFGTSNNLPSLGGLKIDFVEHYKCESEDGCIFYDPPRSWWGPLKKPMRHPCGLVFTC